MTLDERLAKLRERLAGKHPEAYIPAAVETLAALVKQAPAGAIPPALLQAIAQHSAAPRTVLQVAAKVLTKALPATQDAKPPASPPDKKPA